MFQSLRFGSIYASGFGIKFTFILKNFNSFFLYCLDKFVKDCISWLSDKVQYTFYTISGLCFHGGKILKYWFNFMLIIGIIWNYFSWVSFDNLYFSRDAYNLFKSFLYFNSHCYQINIPLYSSIFICAESFFLIEHSFINYFSKNYFFWVFIIIFYIDFLFH